MEKTVSEILQMDPDDVSKLPLVEQIVYWQQKYHHAWVVIKDIIDETKFTKERNIDTEEK